MKVHLPLALALRAALAFSPLAHPRPAAAQASAAAGRGAVAVLAGGCYWGMESVFRHVRGVVAATSGYALAAGDTQPVEAVRLVYDPSRLSYRQILAVFFSVAHDPTQVDRQGPDVGPEYRSELFPGDARQRRFVVAFVDSLAAARVFARPIATRVAALRAFEPAEPSQQDYAERHPADSYIVINDAPKVAALRRRFPGLYRP